MVLGVLQLAQAAPIFGGFDIVDSKGLKYHVVSVSKADVSRLEEKDCDVGCVQDCWRTEASNLLLRCADYCGCKELVRSSSPQDTEPVAEEQPATEGKKKRKCSTPSEEAPADVPATEEQPATEGKKKRKCSSPSEEAEAPADVPATEEQPATKGKKKRKSHQEPTTPPRKLPRSTAPPPKEDAPASEPTSTEEPAPAVRKTKRSTAPPQPKPDEATDTPTEESAEPTAAFAQCSSDCFAVCGTKPSCILSCQSHFCKTQEVGSLWTGLLCVVVGVAIVAAFYVSYRHLVLKKKPQRLLGERLAVHSSP